MVTQCLPERSRAIERYGDYKKSLCCECGWHALGTHHQIFTASVCPDCGSEELTYKVGRLYQHIIPGRWFSSDKVVFSKFILK